MEEVNSRGKYLLRSNRVARIILGAAFTLSLTLSPNPGQAQSGSGANPFADATLVQRRMASYLLPDARERSPKNFGLSETPATQLIPRRDGGVSMAFVHPLRSVDRLPGFASLSPVVSPSSAPIAIRSKPDNLADRTLTQARAYLGTPYRRGGSLKAGNSTDCSGFVQFIYKKADIDLPRSSPEQAREGAIVTCSLDFAKLRPGDLLFFSRSRRHIGHVGIYLGEEKMIHASTGTRGVIISDLLQSTYQHTFVVAKRFF
jgi:cell wall-associated NlpC family hydrolase